MKFDKGLMGGSSTLLVLSLLERGDKYGYEMIRELEICSDKTFSMQEGTLYPVLHGLEKDGLVEAYEKKAETGRIRRYYRITRKGKGMLRDKREEWEVFTRAVNSVIGGGGHALG